MTSDRKSLMIWLVKTSLMIWISESSGQKMGTRPSKMDQERS